MKKNIIPPVTKQQQAYVIDRTNHFVDLASQLFNKNFQPVPVNFKLTGRAAGMYHVNNRQRYIRYNPYIFSKYFEDNLQNTVPHEVAHYIADMIYGIRNIRPHGKEWQSIMVDFGCTPKVRCDYNLEGIPQRTQRRFNYQCNCREYEITTRRHNMIQNRQRIYHCPKCHYRIDFLSDSK